MSNVTSLINKSNIKKLWENQRIEPPKCNNKANYPLKYWFSFLMAYQPLYVI